MSDYPFLTLIGFKWNQELAPNLYPLPLNMFTLDFSRIGIILLFLLPALINLVIFIYVRLSFQKSKLNFIFSLFVLFICLFQAAEGLVRMSPEKEQAELLHHLSEASINFVMLFAFLFVTFFTANRFFKKGWVQFTIIYFPTILLFVFKEVGQLKVEIVKAPLWYWIAQPVPNFAGIFLTMWTSILGLLMITMLVTYLLKAKSVIRRTQAKLLLAGFLIPVIGGMLGEGFIPLLLNQYPVPLTTALVTGLSLCSLIAIKKYKMFEFSPRNQWEDIVKQMNEGLVIVNTRQEVMYANETFCRMMGYKFEEIEGKNGLQLFLDQSEVASLQALVKPEPNKKYLQFEVKARKKDGGEIWLSVRNTPFIDSNGKVIGSLAIQTDITEQRKSEEILRYNESRLKQAQAVGKVGSWEINFASGKSIWSEEAYNIYGVCEEEKDKQSYETWMSYLHPEDRASVLARIEKSNTSLADLNFRHRIITPGGVIKHIHSVATFEFNGAGQPVGLFGVCHDISDQVEAEQSLRESEVNMRTFIDESLMSIYFVDPVSMKILYSNPALSNLLGYTQEELREMSPYTFVNHTKENISSRVKEVMDNKRINNGEREWKRKDGRIVNVLVSSFYHKRNGTDAIYVAAQDITDIKKTESELQETNKELELFIYKASHDIRGPLASIMGLVNVSKMEVKDPVSEKYFDMIDNSVQKLDYTLSELVKAMKIKDVSVFNEKVNFHNLVNDLLKKFTHFPGFRKLDIRQHIHVTGSFYTNRSVLETIMQNLIENAIKYQRTTGNQSFLDINITGNEDKVEIKVEDNGTGIEDAFKTQVFDMYFKANEGSKGSGLGLYLVKKGVTKLGGEIELKSKLGQGTTFTVSIPSQNRRSENQKDPLNDTQDQNDYKLRIA
jgi:PAS domain S-box-containing protein